MTSAFKASSAGAPWSSAWAARKGAPEMVRILVEAGADLQATDNRGRTPLEIAQTRTVVGAEEVVAILEAATDDG